MSDTSTIIPHNERYEKLREILFTCLDQINCVIASDPALATHPRLFLFLIYPWLVQLDGEQKDLEQQKNRFASLGFDGEVVKRHLEEILANDKHLRECCPTPLQLAAYLDVNFLTKHLGHAHESLESAFSLFEQLTYHQGRFKRIALSHLFNFDMDEKELSFEGKLPFGAVQIKRLETEVIPIVLGESGSQAFLHPPGIGDYFVYEEEHASDVEDGQWLYTKREKALYFARILKYLKPGVVHLGYTVPFFLPVWVNHIRRAGLFFYGDPRRNPYENGQKFYCISASEKEQLSMWWQAATTPKIVNALENIKNKLRQEIYRSGVYYEMSHEKQDSVDRLISIAIGFEALFSPFDQGELKFRISQSAAQFIGDDGAERLKIFEEIQKMYKLRSKILHGSFDAEKHWSGQLVIAEEIDKWADYLRRAISRFLALYLKGNYSDREPILKRIALLGFDDSKRRALLEESDLERVLADAVRGDS